VNVRLAERRDQEAWERVWNESARAGFTELLPEGHEFPEPDRGRWLELFEDPAVSQVLVEEDGELFGISTCGESRDDDVDDSVGEIRTFFVAPGSWGRGVGRALMDGALESLRERGYGTATVWSFTANERANAFYEALGFTRDGAEDSTGDAWADIPGIRYRRSL
jgi:ribosomal protein S18 acetylase RimI-like enzyme